MATDLTREARELALALEEVRVLFETLADMEQWLKDPAMLRRQPREWWKAQGARMSFVWWRQRRPGYSSKAVKDLCDRMWTAYMSSEAWAELKRMKRQQVSRCQHCGMELGDYIELNHPGNYRDKAYRETVDDVEAICWECHRGSHPDKDRAPVMESWTLADEIGYLRKRIEKLERFVRCGSVGQQQLSGDI